LQYVISSRQWPFSQRHPLRPQPSFIGHSRDPVHGSPECTESADSGQRVVHPAAPIEAPSVATVTTNDGRRGRAMPGGYTQARPPRAALAQSRAAAARSTWKRSAATPIQSSE
jgi:hypothetical protein